MKVSEAVATRIKDLMKEKGLSRYRLEMDSGVAPETIKNLLKANREVVNLRIVLVLARTIGMTAAEFFDDPLFESEYLMLD